MYRDILAGKAKGKVILPKGSSEKYRDSIIKPKKIGDMETKKLIEEASKVYKKL